MAYLIDSDIFISGKNSHYGMDFCPGFWDWMLDANRRGTLLSIQAVCEDLCKGADDLAAWARARDENFFVAPAERDFAALANFSNWINSHARYSQSAKQTFLSCSDFFVVSQALAGGHTVVTHEVAADSVHRVKIPSVCDALGVRHQTCWQMLRAERVRFVLGSPDAPGATQ